MTCCAATNTGLEVRWAISSPSSPVVIQVSGTGTTRTVTINVGFTGRYLLRMWLCDSVDPSAATLTPPDGDPTVDWWEVTAADGTLTKTITHSGSGTWYLAVVLIGSVGVSSAITFP